MEMQDLGKTSTGMQPNVAGLLSYAFGWVSGLIFFLIEKENKFVRFHAFQSMLVFGGLSVLGIASGIFSGILTAMNLGILAGLISSIVGLLMLAGVVAWIVLMVKAYQGEKFKLPVVGDIAEKNA